MELELVKKFYEKNISMWNPNTNYLTYISHFEKIIKYCIDNKTYKLTYKTWLDLLNSSSGNSKIGSEAHNICQSLNIIKSNYIYRDIRSYEEILIELPRDLIYQYMIDNNELKDESWKIITDRYLDFLDKNNIFELKRLDHVQRVCLNLLVSFLLNTNKASIDDLKDKVKFARETDEAIDTKIQKVYRYDVCSLNANILSKMNISTEGQALENADKFLNAMLKSLPTEERIKLILNNSNRIKGAYNMIYYGTPGCGKSYLVNKEYCENEENVVRTTFHPEYSNSDFVGQIIPKIDEDNNVVYKFQEGPFTTALLKAIEKPTEKICLVIEEINRGNASAIFGDIFQLLDRDDNGNSMYAIDNYAITKFLKEKGCEDCDKIIIPSNLWIIATMNTNDQNVYTLDTAFKRRWKMHRVSNEFEDDNELAPLKIPGSKYTWKEFVIKINEAIIKNNPAGLNGEDKQIGVYFVSKNELVGEHTTDLEKTTQYFAEKVLLYIWDDIAKLDPSIWFDSNCKSFDDLIKEFNKKHLKVFKDLFNDEIEDIKDFNNE